MKILNCDDCGRVFLRIVKLRENHISCAEKTAEDIDIDEQRLKDAISRFLSCVGDFCPECSSIHKTDMLKTFGCVLFRNVKC